MQDRPARRTRRRVRPAGPRPHRPRRDERRRGAVQGRQEAPDQADRRLRDLPRRRPHAARPAPGAQPPDAAGRERRRLPQPGQALQPRLPGGPLARQAIGRPGPAGALQRRRDRAHRLPGQPLLPAPGQRPARRGARPRRRPAERVRPRPGLLRGPEERHRRPGQGQRGHRAHRARARPPAGGHGRRALPAPRGPRPSHGVAVRADEVDAGRAEDDLRDERVLPQGQRRDGGRVRRVARGAAVDDRHRAALQRRHRAGQAADPVLPDPRRQRREDLPARAGGGGAAAALRRPRPGRGPRAGRDGARRHRRDGLQRLLPDRVGLRQLREVQRDRGRPGPRLGRRLAGRLLPGASPTSTRCATTCCSSAS